MGKVLMFGGTFNPPHIAHRLMLQAAAELKNIDKILVIPTNIPPHKEVANYCPSKEHRLNMCRLLLEGVENAVVSDMELNREGKSYTYDTLIELKEKYDDLSILIGADMITTFFSWYRYKDVLNLCDIIAVRRPGIDNRSFDKAVETLRNEGGNITVLDAKMPDVSSTDIREETDDETQLSKKVPNNIYEYCKRNGLYESK